MKDPAFNLPRSGAAVLVALGLWVVGCGNAAQQQAYDKAAQAERQLTGENAPAILLEYRQVIALQPGSAVARKAQARIDAIAAKMKAAELHKAVFQEHGID
jgi:hypothetical protein